MQTIPDILLLPNPSCQGTQQMYKITNNIPVITIYIATWWRHQMETFFALLALCGNSLVTGEFHSQRPVKRSFNVLFDLRPETNGWVNNRDVGDLRRHPAYYDITAMSASHATTVKAMLSSTNSFSSWPVVDVWHKSRRARSWQYVKYVTSPLIGLYRARLELVTHTKQAWWSLLQY